MSGRRTTISCSAGDDVVGEVGVDRRRGPRRRRTSPRRKPEQAPDVVALREALAAEQAARSSSALGYRKPSVVTRSTRGCRASARSSARSTRAVVDLPTATQPATPMTNGVRARSPRKVDVALVQSRRAPTYSVEQPGQRAVDRCRPRRGRSGRRDRGGRRRRRRSAAAAWGGQPAPRPRSNSTNGEVDCCRRGAGSRRVTPQSDVPVRGSRAIHPRAQAPPERSGHRPPPAVSLTRMCGIVGTSAGPTSTARWRWSSRACARLEYRGYDSAGVAVVTPDGLASAKRAGKLGNLLRGPRAPSRSRRHRRDRAHPVGHPRCPTDDNAHPHLAGGRPSRADPQRHHRELPRRSSSSSLDDGVVFLPRPTPRWSRTCSPARTTRPATSTAAMQRGRRRLEGAYTLLAVHADAARHRRRRPTQLAAGHRSRRRRELPRLRRRRLHLPHQARRWRWVRTSRRRHRRRRASWSPTPTATPREARRFTRRLGRRGRGQGRLRVVHGQGDPRPAAGGADTLLGRSRRHGRLELDELRIDESVLRSVDKIVVVACGTAAYAGHVASTPSSTGAASRSRSSSRTSSATATRWSARKTLVVAISQSGETMDTIMAVRHAREQGAKVLAIVNTHGSTIPRESDAVLYTHAGPEVAVASTKAFLAQITACYLLGLYLAQLRGQQVPRRGARGTSTSWRRCRRRSSRSSTTGTQVRDVARSMKDVPTVLFLGRHVGYPVALEGALEAQGARLHPRRGVRRRRAEARPDRAHRGGRAGLRHRADAAPPRAARQGGLQHPGGPRARRPHPRDRGGGRRRRSRSSPTSSSGSRGRRRCMMPLVTVVPLQIFASRAGRGQGLRRRPAAQPRQVGHGRVGQAESVRWRRVVRHSTCATSLRSCATARARTPRLRERLFTVAERDLPPTLARGPVRREGGDRQGAGRPAACAGTTAPCSGCSGGAPVVEIARHRRRARRRARACTRWHLSISHDAGIASAMVVAEGESRACPLTGWPPPAAGTMGG